MTERQQDVLRLQAGMIPTLRTAFASALDQLDSALVHLRQRAHLQHPWLGDETSLKVAVHYSSRAMDGPGSSFEALLAYRDELGRIHETLQRMEEDYARNEGQGATAFGQRA